MELEREIEMVAQRSEVEILYKYVGGAHFFSSNDDMARGLCVANRDLRKAYNEVGRQLTLLAKMNRDEATNFEPAVSYEEFEDWYERS